MTEALGRLDWLARLGFLARAIVYILLGYIAISTRNRADEGQNAVFDTLRAMPGGGVILALTAAGLLAYGIFRLIGALIDIDGEGSDTKGIGKRVGQAASGIGHMILAWSAWQFRSQYKQSGNGDSASQAAAGTLLDLPVGWVLVAVLGAYFLVVAGSQAMKAYKASFMRQIRGDAPHYTCTLGRIGHAARAVVFAIIGLSMIRSAWTERESEAYAIGGAVDSLRSNETIYLLVAGGLLIFGVFSLILARYRIVPRVDVARALPGGKLAI